MVTSPSLRSGFALSLERKEKKKQHQSFSLCTTAQSPQIFSEGRRCLYAGLSHYHKSTWSFTVGLSQRQTYFIDKIWKLLQIRIQSFSHFSTTAFYGTELWSRGSVNPWQVPTVIKIVFPLTLSAISIHNQEKRSGDLKKMITKGNMLRSFIKFSQLILSRNDNNISQNFILLIEREAHHFLYIFYRI